MLKNLDLKNQNLDLSPLRIYELGKEVFEMKKVSGDLLVFLGKSTLISLKMDKNGGISTFSRPFCLYRVGLNSMIKTFEVFNKNVDFGLSSHIGNEEKIVLHTIKYSVEDSKYICDDIDSFALQKKRNSLSFQKKHCFSISPDDKHFVLYYEDDHSQSKSLINLYEIVKKKKSLKIKFKQRLFIEKSQNSFFIQHKLIRHLSQTLLISFESSGNAIIFHRINSKSKIVPKEEMNIIKLRATNQSEIVSNILHLPKKGFYYLQRNGNFVKLII